MIQRIATILCLLLPFLSFSQESEGPRLSPIALVTGRYKDTYMKIVFGQPQKKGRDVFGKLVPYGEVWRTGANEATEITITRDIIINATPLKAGTYSLFTIPDREKWTIIFNSDLGLWGAYNYNQKMDVLRFDAAPTLTDKVYEAFTILIDQQTNKANVILLWDNLKVNIPVQFNEPKP